LADDGGADTVSYNAAANTPPQHTCTYTIPDRYPDTHTDGETHHRVSDSIPHDDSAHIRT
jgi:hypothetical protein